jgi:hypothetical protein
VGTGFWRKARLKGRLSFRAGKAKTPNPSEGVVLFDGFRTGVADAACPE